METTGIETQKQLFGMIFLLAQRWQVMGDRELAESGITTKQWLLLVTMQAMFQNPPSMNELAQAMGSSRQNIKELTSKLEKRGFVAIFQDPLDKRVLRTRLTDRNQRFWEERADQDERYVASLFEKIPEADLEVTCRTIEALLTTIELTSEQTKMQKRRSQDEKHSRSQHEKAVEMPESSDLDQQSDLHNRFDWADY